MFICIHTFSYYKLFLYLHLCLNVMLNSLSCIFVLRGKIWVHKTSLILPLLIEVSVPSQESERLFLCMLEVSILTLSLIFLLGLRTVPTVCYFLFFNFCIIQTIAVSFTNKVTLLISFYGLVGWFMVFKATFINISNISWR